ncbi:hypothetical protein Agabi119p4_6920 [Agaricus bisporus var. burnettii]|uniref:Transcription initiation factor IIF subunit beta n=1 Tax=Agaricus bisporus var. burnettii TaxID=192524 RepID=A0A8H7F0E5_AGABI|nr:hypothetical protein Agabi119p4_6920 [Agaricus bisporus var. burnettii]
MDGPLDDEKKPFDAEVANDDDAQPDPDEHLMLDQGSGRVWLVKIPKFLLKRWASVNAEDVHLATIRVYTPPSGGKPRFILFLPPNREPAPPNSQETANGSPAPSASPAPPPASQHSNRPTFNFATSYATTGAEPDCYELDMVNEAVENQIVVAERPKDSSLSVHGTNTPFNSRARTTILTGRIKHECNLRPSFTENYRKQMRERHIKANTKQRQIRMIEDAGVSGGRGGINRLSSGVGVGSGGAFRDLIKTRQKPAKGGFERMARIPRNQLLDQLFSHFRDTPHWGLRPLRDKTQQPEAYLKDVLSEIAFLHRSGEFNGMWELKENFKDENINSENVPAPDIPGDSSGPSMELDEDYDDEDDDEMEEVS